MGEKPRIEPRDKRILSNQHHWWGNVTHANIFAFKTTLASSLMLTPSGKASFSGVWAMIFEYVPSRDSQ
jgi:hypothetical protein